MSEKLIEIINGLSEGKFMVYSSGVLVKETFVINYSKKNKCFKCSISNKGCFDISTSQLLDELKRVIRDSIEFRFEEMG